MTTLQTFAYRAGRYVFAMLPGLVTCLLGLTSGSALAQQCTLGPQSSSFAFSNINVSRDAPIGATISEQRTVTISVRCPRMRYNSRGISVQLMPTLNASSTVQDVWESGIPGIGIRATAQRTGRGAGGAPGRASDTSAGTYRTLSTYAYSLTNGYTGTLIMTHQLVKTGQINTNGQINIGPIYSLRSINRDNGSASGTQATVSMGNSTVASRSCRVTTPSVAVPMEPAHAMALEEAGATTGRTGFFIGLQCDTDTNVFITLTDATMPGNRTDLLTLASDSTAQGVRLRIRNPDNEPVRFGPDSATAGTVNQWRVGQSSGVTNIRMSAEYVSTGNVMAGTVRGLATFTMSYQ
ncbi:hypothetical protein D9X30_2324 [Cupriavidus sp. U2]|nr:hypothetical protein D9X30_2324 [Cupriavidus sp. U2]